MEIFSKSNNFFHKNENFIKKHSFFGWDFSYKKKIGFNLQDQYLVEYLYSYTTTHQLQKSTK